jgi:hypothetical protein
MAVFHIILRHLALIGLPLFCEEIDREAFLKECSALVFLVLKDAFHCTGLPALFSRWSRNPICCQLLCNGSRRQPLHESSINPADNDCLLRNDFWKTVCAFAVTEELLVWEVDLSIRKPLPLPPGHVLRNGAAFFLCQARHDGEQQFALAVKGIAIMGYYNKIHDWIKHQAEQDERMDRIEKAAAAERKELTLIVYALSACLDGLGQLGANHTVPVAKDKLDKYINKQAHQQEV